MSTKIQDLAAAWAANRGVSASTSAVYSTQSLPAEATSQKAKSPTATEPKGIELKGAIKVSRETKGRGGKAVTLVTGVPLQGEELAALGKRLKTACGSGGTVKDGVIEVQGEHISRIVNLLTDEGFKAKRAGG